MSQVEGAASAGAEGQQPNLTAQTAFGLRWSYLSTATLMVANLAYTATISRLLDPSTFGLSRNNWIVAHWVR